MVRRCSFPFLLACLLCLVWDGDEDRMGWKVGDWTRVDWGWDGMERKIGDWTGLGEGDIYEEFRIGGLYSILFDED